MHWLIQWSRKDTQRSDKLCGQGWELAVVGKADGANQVRFQYGSPRCIVNKTMADYLPWDEARERAVKMLQAYIRTVKPTKLLVRDSSHLR